MDNVYQRLGKCPQPTAHPLSRQTAKLFLAFTQNFLHTPDFYEQLPELHQSFVELAMIRLLLRNLATKWLFKYSFKSHTYSLKCCSIMERATLKAPLRFSIDNFQRFRCWNCLTREYPSFA